MARRTLPSAARAASCALALILAMCLHAAHTHALPACPSSICQPCLRDGVPCAVSERVQLRGGERHQRRKRARAVRPRNTHTHTHTHAHMLLP